ncbi:unnamed protein product [Macrosiphum euphorbiae]|uniref:EF-hand domain-containing protein n=1 Tax=Macrosiphum euphorbiae TaxID=13131 RepID=A0AAV0WJQ4_9HEMI|nr:unnamed protein product [Macrosiphum euphorbiae]
MGTVEDEAHYDSKFLGSDADENGYVSGLEFLYYFKYGVCDINRHRKLDKEQFSPAMWLVESKLKRGLIHQIHFPLK